MFVFTTNPEFTWPVEVKMPNAEGTITTSTFTGHFILVEEEDFFIIDSDLRGSERTDAEIRSLKEVFTGFSDIETPDGGSLACTEETIEAILRQVPVRMGVTTAFLEATRGGGVRLGNFAASPRPSGAKRRKTKANRR